MSEERYASAKAVFHFLVARRAERDGDDRAVAEELSLALVYDDSSPQLLLARGWVLLRLGELREAEADARRALERAPRGTAAAEARQLLGELRFADGQTERALEEWRAAIALAVAALPRQPSDEEAFLDTTPWHRIVRVHLDRGEEEAAARAAGELASRAAGDGSAYREMGTFFLERHDARRAERYLRSAVEQSPADLEARRQLGELLDGIGRTREARMQYDEIVRRDPDDLDALFALGRNALASGETAVARARFADLLDTARDDDAALIKVALAWVEGSQPREALALLEERIAAGDADARLQLARGVALEQEKRWTEAIGAFERVPPSAGDDYVSARLDLAQCLSRLGRTPEAARSLERALTERPHEARLLTQLAAMLERAGQRPQAIAALQRAVRDDAGAPAGADLDLLYDALAGVLQRAGRLPEAIELLKGALAARPREESLLYALGDAYGRAGESEAAVAQMKALLALHPDHADAMNFVAYSYAERGVKLDEAEKLALRAVELDPANGAFLDSLGWIAFKKGEHARAAELLEKAVSIGEADPTILEHLGDAYRTLERPEQAASAYRRALNGADEGGSAAQRTGIEKKLRDLPGAGAELRPVRR